jgi:mono/diheme cytochrome c family protein
MNTSALTLIRLGPLEVVNTVLLDDLDRGAANPWALAWTADGQRLCVSHAGTHELSVIDFPSLLERLDRLARGAATPPNAGYLSASRTAADVPQDLAFLVGLRQRVPLRGQGARALAVDGADVYVAHYFTDTLDTVRLDATPQAALETRLAPGRSLTPAERGEMLFNDGALSFQGWQSCATCHSEDGRIDGLNWDLLNDGIGNPKNSKTLLLSHRTPPAMSMGVRETAETAVRAGIRHILFATPEPGAAEAMDTWLKGLKAVPSPHLERGKLSPAAKRGRRLFDSSQTGCARCHPPGLFTDLQHYDVGTSTPLDREAKAFDTPSLIEVWRTAPYLHDGSASTLREVLTDRNRNDTHGRTSHLTPAQIDDLAEYVLSL